MAPIPQSLVARVLIVTPHEPAAPYTTPSLTANLICRVAFASMANLSCSVPLKNLYRHGEFAAVVFVCAVMVLNTMTIVDSLIWRNDNVNEWWMGYGWCDVHSYIFQPMLSVYTTSIVAIMHNLAQQVGLLRAGPLTIREKRRKTLIQAFIIFPLPAIQLGWIYPLAGQRYVIGTLKGCIWTSHSNWPFLVFFMLPAPILASVAGFYSILIWKRYMEIERSTRSAVMSNTSTAERANRTRRRLFAMTLCILVPYIPVVWIHSALQVKGIMPLEDFNFGRIHYESNPWPWHSIIRYTHDQLTFFDLNSNYLNILTALPVLIFFGVTKDTKDTYRRCILAMRLDRLFPKLRKPSGLEMRRRSLGGSWGSQPTPSAAKSTGEGSGRSVHITTGPRTPEFLSSPPPPYHLELDGVEECSTLMAKLISSDIHEMLPKPQPCVIMNDKDSFALENSSFPSPDTAGEGSGHRLSFSQASFSPSQSTTTSPAVVRVHAQASSNVEHYQTEQTDTSTWLPRLPAQLELMAMIQKQITRSSSGEQESVGWLTSERCRRHFSPPTGPDLDVHIALVEQNEGEFLLQGRT